MNFWTDQERKEIKYMSNEIKEELIKKLRLQEIAQWMVNTVGKIRSL